MTNKERLDQTVEQIFQVLHAGGKIIDAGIIAGHDTIEQLKNFRKVQDKYVREVIQNCMDRSVDEKVKQVWQEALWVVENNPHCQHIDFADLFKDKLKALKARGKP